MHQLPGAKERSLFTQVVKHYENKQYKKGISQTMVFLAWTDLDL